MARNTFATIGILAVLLLSLGVVSAVSENMSISIDVLNDVSNKLSNVVNGENSTFQFTINNSNSSIGKIYVNFSGVSGANYYFDEGDNISVGTPKIFNTKITIPTTTNSKEIRVDVYNATDKTFLFRIAESVHFERAISALPLGCTDPTATNTNSTPVTSDNTLCTYPTTFNFCASGKIGTLAINDFELTNLGEGDDDDWNLLDEIEIIVEIENTNDNDDVKDVWVEIMILDGSDNDVTKDFDFKDDKIDIGRIDNDDSEIATFTIDEIPADLEDGDYKVYVKAYQEKEEDTQCVAESSSYLDQTFYQEIKVTRKDDPAIVVKGNIPSISASCGDTVQASFYVYNLGSDKEEKSMVRIFNSKLGIDQFEIIDNLKSGKRSEVSFTLNLPEELSDQRYDLNIITYFDWDNDEDEEITSSYGDNSEDDLDEVYKIRFDILSCQGPAPSITATLDSEAAIGKELVIKAILTNNGEDNDFVISTSNFESWADLISVTPLTASIKEGEFAEVVIKLMPTKSGTQSLKINAIVDGESHDQSVSVSITGTESIFDGISNTILYIIIGIVALLVLIFLALIVRVSRRSAKPQF